MLHQKSTKPCAINQIYCISFIVIWGMMIWCFSEKSQWLKYPDIRIQALTVFKYYLQCMLGQCYQDDIDKTKILAALELSLS